MEEKKTILDYLGQIFMIYGITIGILNVFCIFFGEGAKEVSSMFSMGKHGLSVSTMIQFFAVTVISVLMRFLFFTDVVIKRMSVVMRAVCMVIFIFAVIVIFAFLFGWFPINMWQPWVMFLLCFGVCFVVSALLTRLKEKTENRKMAEALERLKQENVE